MYRLTFSSFTFLKNKYAVISYSLYCYFIIYFIKTSFAWGTKLSVNTAFQFGPGVKHNTSKILQYIKYTKNYYCHKKIQIKIGIKKLDQLEMIINIQK